MSKALKMKPNSEPSHTLASAGVMQDGKYMPPPEDRDGRIWVRTSALVHASALELYDRWHDVENAPQWQEQISQVTRTGGTISRWVMRSGSGEKTIEWDSEILADEPGRRIAWRSIGGESINAGEVIFEPAPGRSGTMVTVLQEFRLGKLAAMWETLVGRNPRQAVVENLRHFKALAETGEIPRIEGQPHGPRGTIAGLKKSIYGENIDTPPAEKRRAGSA